MQREVDALWQQVTTENASALADIEGYRGDFHRLFGFGVKGVDYAADVPDSLI